MSLFARLDRHADLVHRMADTVGVDLAEQAMRGALPEQDIRGAVLSCMSCSKADDCGHWLDAHADGADAPPSYCRNTSMFDALMGG